MEKILNKLKIFYIPAIVVIIDQITKQLIRQQLHIGEQIRVIGDYLKFTYVENPGIAFGVEVGSLKVLLSLFTLAISIVITYYLYKHRNEKPTETIPLAFILGGAIGNMIDRIFYGWLYGYESLFKGHVIDFIQVYTPSFTLFGRYYSSFPIFNIADSAVTIGVTLMLIFSFLSKKEETVAENKQNDNIG